MQHAPAAPASVRISPATLDTLAHEVRTTPGNIDHFVAVLDDGSSHALPHDLSQVVRQALQALSDHGAVSIGPLPEELTSTTAAELLGVSRPTLLKMARANEIPSHRIGSHTRFKRNDVLVLQAEGERKKAALLDEIRDLGEALDPLPD